MKKSNQKNISADGGLLHALGHDAKQPLGLIRAYSYYIKKSLPDTYTELAPFTDKINYQVDVLTRMLTNVVESIKLQNKQVVLNPVALPLTELLKDVINEARIPNLEASNARNINNLIITADRLYFKLALANILENAVNFCDNSADIHFQTDTDSHHVTFIISNTGSLIAENDLPHIFDQFYKGKNSNDSPVKGLGVGLYVSQKIIELHGGSITVDNTTSQTVVTVNLPL